MSATATPATSDRSDFRTVMVGGTEIGLITAAGVVAFLVVSRRVTAALPQQLLEALIVLATGVAVSFLPGRMTAARHGEGLAGAAAMGLWGTVVFMAVDIVALRPLKAYPWTWDAVGGGSTWWYLPIWWMLGTLLAWTGAIVTADQTARGEPTLVRTVAPPLTMLAVAGLGAASFGFAALATWVRFMRRVPHLLSHLMAPRASQEQAAVAAAD